VDDASQKHQGGRGEAPADDVDALLRLLPELVTALRESAPHEDASASLGDARLTPRQMTALVQLQLDGPQPMSSFAAGMGVSPATASAMVERLEQLGLVRRAHDTEDRRVVTVRLSPAAEREAHVILGRRRRDLERTLARFPDVSADVFAAFVAELIRRLREE